MSHIFTRASALALAIAAAATASPVPKEPPPKPDPLYAATRVGDKRVMGMHGRVTRTYTVTVAEPQPDGSVRIYQQSEHQGQPSPFQDVLSVSPKGVFLTGIARNTEGKDIREVRVALKWEPECLVRPAGKGGAKWEWSRMDPAQFRQWLAKPLPGYKVEGNVLITPNGDKFGLRTHVYEAVGVEEVVVPAGTFRAVRVEQTTRDEANPTDLRRTTWYAPGIGVVQTAGNGRPFEQLQSFQPGPAPAKAPKLP